MSGRIIRYASVPGSLLISGEYLITEEGGIGLALAAGGRAHLEYERNFSFPRISTLRGHWPGVTEEWTEADGDSGTLASAVWKEYRESNGTSTGDSLPGYCRITVDTREFYDAEGRKSGYGSSAAAALLFARGLMETTGTPDDNIINCAMRAHRSWQGGRGSAYDIFTSAYGGAGRFTGGKKPRWDALDWPSGLDGWLLRGEKTVSSPAAIPAFQKWKQNAATPGQQFITGFSGEIEKLTGLLTGGTETDSAAILEGISNLAEYGKHLGSEIGVSAEPRLPGGIRLPVYRRGSMVIKSLGAGNETLLLLALDDGLCSEEKKTLASLEEMGMAKVLKVEYDGLRDENSPGEGIGE